MFEDYAFVPKDVIQYQGQSTFHATGIKHSSQMYFFRTVQDAQGQDYLRHSRIWISVILSNRP